MRRSPIPGVDLGVYVAALPLLVRNPVIVVIPLLTAIAGVLLGMIMPGGGLFGLTGLCVTLLGFFGLGAACIMADEAWRKGRASFENGWQQSRRRAGDILMTALGVTLLTTVAGYVGAFLGPLALVVVAVVLVFLIWAVPASAIGGIPGGAALQVSIDRVRAEPLPAVLATVVAVLLIFLTLYATAFVNDFMSPYATGSFVLASLIEALLRSIAIGYIALVLAKTYADTAFGRRW